MLVRGMTSMTSVSCGRENQSWKWLQHVNIVGPHTRFAAPAGLGGLTWCFLGVPGGLFWVFPVVTAGPLPSVVRHLISHPNSGSCGTQPFAVSISVAHTLPLWKTLALSARDRLTALLSWVCSLLDATGSISFHVGSKLACGFMVYWAWRQVGGAGMMTASLACMVTRKPRVLLNVILTIYYVF